MSKVSTPDTELGCIQSALDIIGDKWTALLLKELTECPKTFGELEKLLVGISPRTLSQRLDTLGKNEITSKSLYCEHPPRYRYQLTAKGLGLKDVLASMAEWSTKYS